MNVRKMLVVTSALAVMVAACGGNDDSDAGSGEPPASANSEDSSVDSNSEGTSGATETDDTNESAAPESAATTQAADGADSPARTAEFDFGFHIPPVSLDPHLECHIGCRNYWTPVFETLYDVGEGAAIVPLIASDLPEYSDDGLAMTVPLRPDRTFHDGTPIDAEAVRASIERGKTLDGSTAATILDRVESVEVVDPLTIKLMLNEARPGFEAELASQAGAVISPNAIADGVDIGTDPGDAGSGPYTVESFTPNESVVYNGVPGYQIPDRGLVDTLNVTAVTDATSLLNAFQSGEFDIVYGSAADAELQQQLSDDGFVVTQRPALNTHAILLRITRGELTDPLVRQAMASAIDRETISESLYNGQCPPTSQAFPDPLPAHVPDYDPYPYDPDRARELLAEAGLPDGFELEIVTVSGLPASNDNATVVQQMLGEVGIDVTITPMASADGVQAFNRDEIDARATVVSFRADALGTMQYHFMAGGSGEMAVPQDATLNELYGDLTAAATDDERNAVIQEMGREISDQVFVLPICVQQNTYLSTPEVAGVEQMYYNLYGVADWRGIHKTN